MIIGFRAWPIQNEACSRLGFLHFKLASMGDYRFVDDGQPDSGATHSRFFRLGTANKRLKNPFALGDGDAAAAITYR